MAEIMKIYEKKGKKKTIVVASQMMKEGKIEIP